MIKDTYTREELEIALNDILVSALITNKIKKPISTNNIATYVNDWLLNNDNKNATEPISDKRELFFLDCIKDLVEEKTDNKFQSIYYRKPNSDDIWFEIWIDQDSKNKMLSCSYTKIWSVFKDRFGMEYDDIQHFIQKMVLKHTNWGLVTPMLSRLFW